MTNLIYSEIAKLRPAKDLRGKYTEFITPDHLEKLAKEYKIPHYVITNPFTQESVIVFHPSEIQEWFTTKCVHYNPCVVEQRLTFLRFDPYLHKAPKDDTVPKELSLIKDLYKLPIEEITTPPGVYFLVYEGRIVYIGQAVNVANRIVTHMLEDLKTFEQVYYIPCHPHNLDAYEKSLIRFFQPKYNMALKNGDVSEADQTLYNSICQTGSNFSECI